MTDWVDELIETAEHSDRLFWLDGGGSREWSGRRSIVGVLGADDISLTYDAAHDVVVRHDERGDREVGTDIFDVLGAELRREEGDSDVHWVGYLGYACRPDLLARPAVDHPDAVWMRVRCPRVIDHPPTEPVRSDPALQDADGPTDVPADYARAFATVQDELEAGNSYEVNLTYREGTESDEHPARVYRRLRAINPAPYGGYLRHRGVHLLSSSPERFAVVDRHRVLQTKPIKGTTRREPEPEADALSAARLAADPRYRAENLMIVDLLRNDLAQVCEPGTVEVPHLMEVESYPSVHQLVSTIRGRLAPAVSTVEALHALFPPGSMTGAPKRRTMEIIDHVEATARGVYSGAFGWLSADGRADLGVVIRSLVATEQVAGSSRGFRYTWGTGGGITVHSDLVGEYAETRWKADRLRAAVGPPGLPSG